MESWRLETEEWRLPTADCQTERSSILAVQRRLSKPLDQGQRYDIPDMELHYYLLSVITCQHGLFNEGLKNRSIKVGGLKLVV